MSATKIERAEWTLVRRRDGWTLAVNRAPVVGGIDVKSARALIDALEELIETEEPLGFRAARAVRTIAPTARLQYARQIAWLRTEGFNDTEIARILTRAYNYSIPEGR